MKLIVLTLLTLLQVPNVLGDGDIIPLKAFGNFLGFELSLLVANPNAQGIPETQKFVFSTKCYYSSYFVNAGASEQAQPQQLNAGIGTFDYHDVVVNGWLRPERRPNGDESASGRLCFKSIHVPQDPVALLMFRYQNKVISLWFGNFIRQDGQVLVSYGQVVAELGIGTINERRIAEGPRTQFPLKSLQYIEEGMPPSWVTLNPVAVRISNQLIAEGPCEISFAYDPWTTVVPKSVYDQIVRRLTDDKKTAIAKAVPAILHDMLPKIHEYANTNIIDKFDCSDIDKLPDLHFGNLLIPGRFLYYRQNDQCFLSVVPNPENQGQQCTIIVGGSILSKYHVSVDFNNPGSEFIQFSPMVHQGSQRMDNQAASSSSGGSSSSGDGASSSGDGGASSKNRKKNSSA